MGLGESRYNLWVVLEDDKRIRASVITSIETYPSGKQAFSILMVAGDAKDEWMHFLDVLEAKGKALGCQSMEMMARRGWKPPLKKLGYAEAGTLFAKDLSNG